MSPNDRLVILRPQPPLAADLDLIEVLGGPASVTVALHIPVRPEDPVASADPGRLWLDSAFNPLSFWHATTILCEACTIRFGDAPIVVPLLFPEEYPEPRPSDSRSRALWEPTRTGAFLPPAQRVIVWQESPELVGLLESLDYLDRVEVWQHPAHASRETAAYILATAPESTQRDLLGDALFELMAHGGLLRLLRAQIQRRLALPEVADFLKRSSTGVLERLTQGSDSGLDRPHPSNELVVAPLPVAAEFLYENRFDERIGALVEISREIAELRGYQIERDAQVQVALRFLWNEISEPESLRIYHLAKGSYPESWVSKLRKLGVTLSPIPFMDFMGTLDVLWQRSLRLNASPSQDFACAKGFDAPNVRGYCLKRCEYARRCPVPVELKPPLSFPPFPGHPT